MRPAVFTRLSLYGLLALAPWRVDAQGALPGVMERPGLVEEVGNHSDELAGFSPMWMATPPPLRSVRKLSDSELTCAQIYTETRTLEKASEVQEAEAMQAQAAMSEAQSETMKQAGAQRGGMGALAGSGLLGMIPGGGHIQGHAVRAAGEARRASMQEGAQRMMQAQTRLMQAEHALEHAQARSEHLAGLFLKMGCRLSHVKAAADTAP